jgi:hypothetical protein
MEMAIPESKHTRHSPFRGRWLPVWSMSLGVVLSGAIAIGGNLTAALINLGVFAAFSALFYFGASNETVGGIAAPGRDERWTMIHERALAFAGTIVVLALIGGWVVELANGNDGSPYSEMFLGGTVAYFAAALWLRSRS